MQTRPGAPGFLPTGLPLITILFALTVAPSSPAQTAGKPASAPAPAQDPVPSQGWKGDPFLLPTDAVTGEPLGPVEKQVVLQHEGREFRFAKPENADAFRADPKKYVAAVDEKTVREQLPFYPLDTCLVSGEKLGGETLNLVHKNRLVRLASREQEAEFLKAPAKYVAQLDKAVVAKQGPSYVAKVCMVSDDPLGGEMGDPVDYVVGNRLVRLCCKGCAKDIERDPLKYLLFPDRKNETRAGETEPVKKP